MNMSGDRIRHVNSMIRMVETLGRDPLPMGAKIVRTHFALLFNYTNPTRVPDDIESFLLPLLPSFGMIADEMNVRFHGDPREQSKDPIPPFLIEKLKSFLGEYRKALS